MNGDDADGKSTEVAQDDSETRSAVICALPRENSVEVDVLLSLEESEQSSWNADEVFAVALNGLFDALLPALRFADTHVHVDGDLDFARDRECRAPTIDRHGSFLMDTKVKDRASNAVGRIFRHSIYGASRNPSRTSSRIQPRAAMAFTNSVMVMGMAKLAFGKPALSTHGDASLRINEWRENESGTGDLTAGAHTVYSHAPMASQFSLASSRGSARTIRMAVDYHEIGRREEITHDISTREDRDKLTARIQRKGELKLKLRSMADPTVSFDREEYEALKKNRGAMKSRGKTRGSPTVAINSVAGRPAMSRSGSVTSGNPLGTTTSRSNETTYRSEDYEGLTSEVVTIDKKGELLVGENCTLIARKPRHELQHDMLQRNTIKPRVHFPTQEPQSDEDVSLSAQSQSKNDVRSISRHSPNRAVSRHSPTRSANSSEPNPVFEGYGGTLQAYPKIELDPKKTPLSKGVKIKPPDAQEPETLPSAPSAPKMIVNPPSHGKPTHTVVQQAVKPTLSEDHANDSIDLQLQGVIRSTNRTKQQGTQCTGQSSPRYTMTGLSTSPDAVLPIKSHHGEKYQLQSLRLRTPAYGNRNGRGGIAVLGISLGEILDDESTSRHHAVDQAASLQTPNRRPGGANLPRFAPYLREFSSPPTGHVRVVSAATVASLVSSPTTKNTTPFSLLPSVIREKR